MKPPTKDMPQHFRDNLKKRLESHGADVTCKLYESHHYQYIPDMLVEYLKEAYPPQ